MFWGSFWKAVYKYDYELTKFLNGVWVLVMGCLYPRAWYIDGLGMEHGVWSRWKLIIIGSRRFKRGWHMHRRFWFRTLMYEQFVSTIVIWLKISKSY